MLYATALGVACDLPIEQSHISCFNYKNVTPESYATYCAALTEKGYQPENLSIKNDETQYEVSNGVDRFSLRYDSAKGTLMEIWRFDRCTSQTIAGGACHTVALRADGTVVAVGDHEYDQCDVSGWQDIVAVACGDYHTIGL